MYRKYLRQKTNKNEVNYPNFKYAVIITTIQNLLQCAKYRIAACWAYDDDKQA